MVFFSVNCNRINAAKDNGGPGITGKKHLPIPNIINMIPKIIKAKSIKYFLQK